MRRVLWRSSVLLCLLMGAACGGDDSASGGNTGGGNTGGSQLRCGEGTQRSGNSCVPERELVPECEEGQIISAGACVAITDLCGPNTTLEEGRCVGQEPGGGNISEACDEGTRFDEERQRCVAEVVCGPGTTAVDGECISDATLPGRDADVQESAGENDPAFGGTAQSLTLPAASSSVTVAGKLDAPTDRNGDQKLDQDADVYSIEAPSGTQLRIKLMATGRGAFGFEVHGNNGFLREGPRFLDAPERDVLIPASGTYQIRVTSQAAIYDPMAGAVGGDQHGYLLVVENRGPVSVDLTDSFDVGAGVPLRTRFENFGGTLVKLEHPAASLMRFIFNREGTGLEPTALLLDAQGQVVRDLSNAGRDFLISAETPDSRWLYVDFVRMKRRDEELSVVGQLLAASSFGQPITGDQIKELPAALRIEPQARHYYALDVRLQDANSVAIPQGLVVEFGLDRPAFLPATLKVFSPDNTAIALSRGNGVTFLAEKAGVYVIEFTNDDLNAAHPISDATARTFIPAELGPLGPVGTNVEASTTVNVPSGDVAYFTFRATAPLSANLVATGASASGMGLTMLRRDMSISASATGNLPLGLNREVVAQPGRRVGLVANIFGQSATSVNVRVQTGAAPATEQEPNGRREEATELQSGPGRTGALSSGDLDHFRFVPTATSPYSFRVRPLMDGGDLEVALLDADGRQIEAARYVDDAFRTGAVLQSGSTYYLAISHMRRDAEAEYLVTVDQISLAGTVESEPNDLATNANSAALGANPLSVRVVGTATGALDVDYFSLQLPAPTWMAFEWKSWEFAAQPHADMSLEIFGADGTTQIAAGAVTLLPAGRVYLAVRSGRFSQTGNSYVLEGQAVAFENIGALDAGLEIRRQGSFTEGNRRYLTLTIPEDLAEGMTEAVVLWSNATVDVYALDGTPLHRSVNAGQVFGSSADPSFYSDALTAGDYVVVLEGAPGAPWNLYAGRVAASWETEVRDTSSNSTLESAESLGILTASEPLRVFGSVSATDMADFFGFEVEDDGTGGIYRVVIEQFQLGEAVADIDVTLRNSANIPIADATFTPQRIEMLVGPGSYAAGSLFFGDVGMNSGDYMLRIALNP